MRGQLAMVGVAVGVLLAGSVGLHAEGKIATIDMVTIIEGHPDTASADTLLKQQVEEYQAEQDRMIKEAREMEGAYRTAVSEAENPALSDKARLEKKRALEASRDALRERERDIEDTAKRRQKQLTESSMRMRGRIVDQVQKIVETYAKENGITLVLNGSDTGRTGLPIVMYADSSHDITSSIMALLARDGAGAVNGGIPAVVPAE